jgi:hypothetical protein
MLVINRPSSLTLVLKTTTIKQKSNKKHNYMK